MSYKFQSFRSGQLGSTLTTQVAMETMNVLMLSDFTTQAEFAKSPSAWRLGPQSGCQQARQEKWCTTVWPGASGASIRSNPRAKTALTIPFVSCAQWVSPPSVISLIYKVVGSRGPHSCTFFFFFWSHRKHLAKRSLPLSISIYDILKLNSRRYNHPGMLLIYK